MWQVVGGALLALQLVLSPSPGHAQVEEIPPNSVPPEGMKASGEPGIITLGTPKRTVDLILGPSRSGWTINCLNRSMFTYADDIRVIFVDGNAVSAGPCNFGGDASSDKGVTMEINGRKVFFDAMILRGVPLEGPIGEMKRDAEACYYMGPPCHTNRLHFPPRILNWWPAYSPYSKTRQF
jgi:hypothetical protein